MVLGCCHGGQYGITCRNHQPLPAHGGIFHRLQGGGGIFRFVFLKGVVFCEIFFWDLLRKKSRKNPRKNFFARKNSRKNPRKNFGKTPRKNIFARKS